MAHQHQLQWIPMGGDGAAGILGVAAYFNLLAHTYAFDEIWCTVGTGTTLQGIAASQIVASTLVGFNPGIRDEKLEKKITEQPTNRQVQLVQAPGSRFGKISPDLLESMHQWWHHTGIPTDVVYTGKMLQYWQQNEGAAQKKAKPKSVLLVHTGGLQGNRSLGSDALKFTGEL
jgi:1-aminocyclopropane-1-carboxylate deaminase/D-cysteine desulfhydrase-like pyridoxal-dependent ACC family enzyme